nr:hypothetical protein [Tanacetum cinerariifolium]
TPRNYVHRGTNQQNASFTHKHPLIHMVPTVVLAQSKPIFNTAVRPVSVVVPKIMVTRPRLAHSLVTKSKSPFRRHLTHSQSPKTSNSPPKVTAAKAPVVSAAQVSTASTKVSTASVNYYCQNNIDAAQPKLMLLVYMVTTAEVNREVTTDN